MDDSAHATGAPAPATSTAAGTIEYARHDAPEPARLEPIADGVWWLRMPLPFALDHINLWLLEDGDAWTIVDTGIGLDEVRALWEQLLAGPMGGRPVRRIVVTHFHPDHFGLAGWLHERTGARLAMTRGEFLTGSLIQADADHRYSDLQVAFFRRHGLDEARLAPLARRGNVYRRVVTPPPARYRRLVDGETFRVGEHHWQVAIGTGHAPEHACLHCPSLGVLIAGDQILPRITPNVSLQAMEPEADPLRQFLDSVERFSALPADALVLPSHGLPFRGLHARLAELRAHHLARLDELAEACDRPRTAAELIPVLFRRRLDSHQVMFAMGESLSHLVYLTTEGRLVRLPGDDGRERFASAA